MSRPAKPPSNPPTSISASPLGPHGPHGPHAARHGFGPFGPQGQPGLPHQEALAAAYAAGMPNNMSPVGMPGYRPVSKHPSQAILVFEHLVG